MSINVERFRVGPMYANAYLVYNQDLKAALIDPGGHGSILIGRIEELGLDLKFILLTHGHFDHILASQEISSRFEAQVMIHRDDFQALSDVEYNLAQLFGQRFNPVTNAKELLDGDTLYLGETKIEVIATPGHSKGSVCFLIEEEIFSGDLLFKGSIGRTDLIGGDQEELLRSLSKLSKLPDNLRVWPGHQEQTSLKDEKENNPWMIQARSSNC
ncbi:MAG: MBL fold metallo-hydrolase [Firmicutes bacterium]|nr:MBL fold metallo-hydrolase [Bacillota bacterium]